MPGVTSRLTCVCSVRNCTSLLLGYFLQVLFLYSTLASKLEQVLITRGWSNYGHLASRSINWAATDWSKWWASVGSAATSTLSVSSQQQLVVTASRLVLTALRLVTTRNPHLRIWSVHLPPPADQWINGSSSRWIDTSMMPRLTPKYSMANFGCDFAHVCVLIFADTFLFNNGKWDLSCLIQLRSYVLPIIFLMCFMNE